MQTPFIHLRVRSAYSLLEGALPLGKLVKVAKKAAMPALAVTDTGNLFGALEMSVKLAEAGIQPIVGCTLALDPGDVDTSVLERGRPPLLPALALLAKDEAGYRNLMRLSSLAYLGSEGGTMPCVTFGDLAAQADGLIALTGGAAGPVNQALIAGDAARARQRLTRLGEIFGDRLYVELQRHGMDEERASEGPLVELAYELGLPLVATNDCYFPTRDYFEAHDALLAVAEGTVVADDNRRRLTPEHYFKSASEMAELFKDLPEAVDNTVEIARRCSFWPRPVEPILPRFIAGDAEQGGTSEDGELRRQAEEGLRARLAAHGHAPGFDENAYRERLDYEIGVITKMRYSGYFLIVSDFIKWAKGQSIPVGPGRGSGAGSLVAWALMITDLDPIRFGLLFERFLNPERVSMPDFDIDFCQERRDEVIAYVQQKYGADHVAQIITFGTLQARAVLRDVGRVLQVSYGEVDGLAKLVPADPANPVTLKQAIDGEPRLQEARRRDETVAQLLRIALKLEGLYRHASTHAAGIVISEPPLIDTVPLYRDPRSSMPVTQFNMKWVEQAGLVKFDFLGLKTLTVLEQTLRLLAERGVEIDLAAIPLDDAATYEMLSSADTTGVFQLESAGMRDALARMQPDRFEDIIALVALYRPGPMDNIPTYCHRKHGREKPDYLHPLLQPILEETYGVIIYQEQVMQIGQVLSGYSLGEADLLRRAMGKKIKSEMDKQRARFVDGAVERGISRPQAEHIFELVAKFADYGFNKSHAAAYALLAYQTAYLKTNYPVEFLCASMTLDMGNTDKLNDFRLEAERLGIRVQPPSINASDVVFVPEEGTIRYALAAVKNVGRQAVATIVEERRTGGRFRDLTDFANRVNPRALNRRALENLACAGAFDSLEANRERVRRGCDLIIGTANLAAQARADGQSDMFGAGTPGSAEKLLLPEVEAPMPIDRLNQEHAALGLYLSGHPLDDYMAALRGRGVVTWSQFQEQLDKGSSAARLSGTVIYRKEKRNRNGGRFAFVGLSDPSGQYEVMVFSDQLHEVRDQLEPGRSVVLVLEADRREEGDLRLRVQSIEPVDTIAARGRRGLKVFVGAGTPLDGLAKRLGEGAGEVKLVVRALGGGHEVEIKLPGRYAVTPEVAGAIKALPGVVDVAEL